MRTYGSTSNTNGQQSAFLAKVDQSPSTSESCTTFKTEFKTKYSLHKKEITVGRRSTISDYTGVYISAVASPLSPLTSEATTSLNDITITAPLESYCAEASDLKLSAPSTIKKDFTYNTVTRDPGTESYTVPAFTLSPSSCAGSESITYSDGTAVAPSGLAFNPTTRIFDWSTVTAINTYTIVINAITSPSSLSATASFTLNVVGSTPPPTTTTPTTPPAP